MSDEFLKIAREEIKNELLRIEDIFTKCSTDVHILDNAKKIESHVHKIKGLAPMMGYNNIGELARTADAILKHIDKKGIFPESYSTLLDIFQKIKILFYKGDESINIKDFVDAIRKKNQIQ